MANLQQLAKLLSCVDSTLFRRKFHYVNPFSFILLCLAGWINRQQNDSIEYLQEEIKILKEIHDGKPQLTDRQRKRLATKAKRIRFSKLAEIANLVTPNTLRAWLRKLVGRKYDSTGRRSPGRPATKEKIAELIVRMALENDTWGYTRIRDAINNLGHVVCRDTVANLLKDHGIIPAPERGTRTTWASFLRQHWDIFAATDFFTVETFTPRGIVRYHVLFVMKIATREVHIAGIAQKGHGHWMEQIARNLTDCEDGFLKDCKLLIHDRYPLFSSEFTNLLAAAGVTSVRLPRRSPNLNAFAERFVKSIKHECLNRLVIFSEDMLRYVIEEYLEHYHAERNHQGINSQIIKPNFSNEETPSQQNSRLGGLLNFYGLKAA